MDQSKTVEVTIMNFSPHGSPVPLVSAGKVSYRNSNWFPRAAASNEGGVGENKLFSRFERYIPKTVRDTSNVD